MMAEPEEEELTTAQWFSDHAFKGIRNFFGAAGESGWPSDPARDAAMRLAAVRGRPTAAGGQNTYASGKRHNALARVWLTPGRGQITVNGRDYAIYFPRPVLQMMVRQPLEITKRVGKFDVDVIVEGSGLSAQAAAVRRGISRALAQQEPGLKEALTLHGLLTRDASSVMQRKYGKGKARRSFHLPKAVNRDD